MIRGQKGVMVYFISGVDTDAGKSIATGWLARRWLTEGKDVITLKLVQTGNRGSSEDIARHRAMMGRTFPEDAEGLTAPQIFAYPCSPHLAAKLEEKEVDLACVLDAVRALEARHEIVLVEGAGGLLVPLTETLTTLDFVIQQGWEVIFVTGGVLGSISHTLLAFEALQARRATVAGVIYNRYPGRKDLVIDNESCAFLRKQVAERFPQAQWDELPVLDLSPASPLAQEQPVRAEEKRRPRVKTFPVNFLLEGKRALVVGGGQVGLRKTRALLDAGAEVRLVCPKALPEFDALPVEWRERGFMPEDVDGVRVVLACTNDKHVNRQILSVARIKGVPCCCADGNWAEADFIVPATLRTDDLLISVSTNGQSCRTAKEVKNALARSLAQCSPGVLFVHGIECAVPLPPVQELAKRLSFLNGLYGWCFLQTCNRTELLAWAAPELIASGLLAHAMHLPSGAYTHFGERAMHHLVMVLAGMRSHMVGEFHIVGQVRDAMDTARQEGWAHGSLLQAYADALKLSQVVRKAIQPLIPEIEVEDLALAGAQGRVVIAGTGKLGRDAVAKAHALGLEVTVLYHQHPMAGEESRPLDSWREAIQGADRFITALACPEPLFDAQGIATPIYDLGAPQNVRGGEKVFNLDSLRGDYLARTGKLSEIVRAAEDAYRESTHA